MEPTAAVLRNLRRTHLLSAPFENLDIHLGRPIWLDPAHLYEKTVSRRRGGYCFELNGLFALLLEAVGFQVLRLSASSVSDDGAYLADFEHLALQVQSVDDPETAWLVDVGWGDGPSEPLRLLEMDAQERDGRVFRPGGWTALSDLRLIQTRNHGLRGLEEKKERLLESETEVRQVLETDFGSVLDQAISFG